MRAIGRVDSLEKTLAGSLRTHCMRGLGFSIETAESDPLALVICLLALAPELPAIAFLAIVQGLTEFLPVSSSGHLVLAQSALGVVQQGITLEVVVHLGTLVSVLAIYRSDIVELVRGLARKGWREPMLLVVATLPAVVVGLSLGDRIEHLFASPRFAARALFGTAAILLVGEWARRRRRPGSGVSLPGWWGALAIGCAQSFAILPGISRSGSTIAMGLLLGLAPAAAARFSFLMAIPAILGAAVLKLPSALGQGSGPSSTSLWIAAAISALVGWLALRFLLAFLGRGAFAWFALYCALLGATALWIL